MDFIANREPQNRDMLDAIGITSLEQLFQIIPSKLRLKPPSEDDGMSEYEGLRLMESLAAKNSYPSFENYLGAGSYEHHVPAFIGAICSKSEFLTSYTPYQPEASQGMLQVIFEFQSAVCALTGLDVSNASVYDGASACAESLLMSLRLKKEPSKVLIAGNVHPHYCSVAELYLKGLGSEICLVPFLPNGQLDFSQLEALLDTNSAAILVQYPNFFGGIDDLERVSSMAKAVGSLMIVCANPLVYGLFASAKELGADIAVGDCQPFGLPIQYGGPYVGYIACKEELVRQLPGRIVGETVDAAGKRGFVLTLQAREQHIRREKATSNICTNQALAALASLLAILWYGKQGVQELALTNYQRAAYLKNQLIAATELTPFADVPGFNEFVVKFHQPTKDVQRHFRSYGIEPGVALEQFYPDLKDYFLVAVTETKSQQQLDRYVQVAQELK